LVSTFSYSQYENVDAIVKEYPRSFSNPQKLADKINADFSKPDEKARAIFTWIGSNVKYDMKAYYKISNNAIAYSYTTQEDKMEKDREFRLKLVNNTLRSGKAVCEGYSSLFTELCSLTGLESVIITGTSKSHYSQIGKLPTASDHAWNAVKIDGKWKLVDATWGAGIVDSETKKFRPYFNDSYFFTDPEKFFLNHYPDDEKWLMTDKSAEDFAALPFYYPQYLKSNYIINADLGFISFPKNVAVKFNIRNLQDSDRLYYITSRNNILDKLNVDSDNNFVIYPSPKLSGYLTIFVNEKPLVSYKIVRS
jgi:transglutaminase/protease-like cytokinesis protein 3